MNFRFLDLHESASGFFPARTSRLISSSVRCEPSSCPVCNLLISVNSAGAEKLQQKSVRSLSQIFERHAPQLSICPAFMKENEPVVIFLFFLFLEGGIEDVDADTVYILKYSRSVESQQSEE